MKSKELREKTKDEIKKLLNEKRQELRKLRFDAATKQVKNNRAIRTARRDAARMLTLIGEMK